jgi:hypothetical protein
MTTVCVDLPDPVHRKTRALAERDGISVDQFLAAAAAEKLAASTNVEYLEQRAARGSPEKLHGILGRVPHVLPDPGDGIDA